MDLVLIAYNGWCAIKPNQTKLYFGETELFEIELFWHLTDVNKNYTYAKLNCFK